MRTVMRIKWGRLIGEILIGAALAIGLLAVMAGAVLQESFKNYPPTDAELQEDPSLARYLPEGDPRIDAIRSLDNTGGSDE